MAPFIQLLTHSTDNLSEGKGDFKKPMSVENFGKYLLMEKIASGGMAEVYLAKSTGASGIAKFLALKRILPQYSDNPEFIEMFKEEAKIAVNLNHSNVVSIFDFGVEKNQFFLVMEYVEGQNLRQITTHLKKENKYFSMDQIIYMVKEVAAGIDHAHRCLDGTTGRPLNITHRDMSPQNIMVSFEGEIKVVDFGIAKAESQLETTRAGTIKGKFGYMSPEQADGQIVDLRTDIFSLGIVLWELLAGERLFTSNSEAATLRKIRECQIPSLKKINPAVPAELERICNKALAKDKGLRYQTAAAFHRDLNRFLNTQYPEFSPHDFSVFMKSAFSQMFIENRRKLIEYAKYQLDDSGSTNQTETVTMTKTEDHQPVGLVEKDYDPEVNIAVELASSSKVNLVNLKLGKQSPPQSKRPTTVMNPNLNYTNTGVKRPPPLPRASAPTHSWTNRALGAAFVVVAALGFLKSDILKGFTTPASKVEGSLPVPTLQPSVILPSEGSTENASKQPYVVVIESRPAGARVFINGIDTGMITPSRRVIDANQEFTVAFRLDGYQYYEKRERAVVNGHQIFASLLPLPKMGYINLEVMNGGSNPVVIINGQRLDEKLPLRNYAIPAGTLVKIQAHNPFTGLSAEQAVTVGVNQRIQVNLILSKRQPSSVKKRN